MTARDEGDASRYQRPAGHNIDIDGISTHYFSQGQGDTIVLLHGASLAIDSYLTWFPVIESLSRDFRVIAFDQWGFGRTDRPRDGRYKNRLERARHAIRFLEAMAIEGAILVGHSEGGFVASFIAIERPEMVSKLVIVTSGGTAPRLGGDRDDGWMRASEDAYNHGAAGDDEEAFVRSSATHQSIGQSIAGPAFERQLRESYRIARENGNWALLRDLPPEESDVRLYTKLQEEWILPRLGEISVPTLLIWAAGDPTVPVERGVALMRLLPNADLHVFHGAGHLVMHQRASDFSRLLATWARDD